MQLIPLTQGKSAIIDDVDVELVSQFKWCASLKGNTWYAVRAVKLAANKWTTQHMHTLITGFPRVDHINGNGLDNRRENLRYLTNSLNIRNQHVNWGTSKYKGVYWDKRSKKWHSRIRGRGVAKHIGYFDDEIEAAKAYDRELVRLFGFIAKLNFPEDLL